MDEIQFNEKYWFPNTKIVTVVNPMTEDYLFQAVIDSGVDITTARPTSETRQYRVPAGDKERLMGVVANLYLDQVSKLLAQQDGKFHLMIDWSEKAKYYDQLIAGVDDVVSSFQPYEAYLEKPEVKEPEVAFAQVNKGGRPRKK